MREDVGALAQARGWALRELSWRQPTLEQLFARIALGIEGEQEAAADALQPAPESAPGGGLLNLGGPAPAPAEPQPERAVYNLNPFDQGGSRDLGAPKSTLGAPKWTLGAPKWTLGAPKWTLGVPKGILGTPKWIL